VGLGDIAGIPSSPEQHWAPVENPVTPEAAADHLKKLPYKGALANSVRTHNNHEEASGLHPSANTPYAFQKDKCCQPQWISHKTRLPRLGTNLCEHHIQLGACACLDNAYLQVAEKELAA